MLELVIPALLAMAAGLGLVIQQVLNTNLRSALGSVALSGIASYAVGFVCMVVLAVALRDPVPSLATARGLPWWAWSGGVFGALYIGLAILLMPKLGAATFIALLVAGQMLASVAFDHFGFLGLEQRPVDLTRLVGVALLVGGVVLIRR